MNRRRFLLALGATPIAVALAPLVNIAPATPAIKSGVALSILEGPLYTPRYVYGRIRISEALLAERGERTWVAFNSEMDALVSEMKAEMMEQVASYGVQPEPVIRWQERDGRVWRRVRASRALRREAAQEATLYWRAA